MIIKKTALSMNLKQHVTGYESVSQTVHAKAIRHHNSTRKFDLLSVMRPRPCRMNVCVCVCVCVGMTMYRRRTGEAQSTSWFQDCDIRWARPTSSERRTSDTWWTNRRNRWHSSFTPASSYLPCTYYATCFVVYLRRCWPPTYTAIYKALCRFATQFISTPCDLDPCPQAPAPLSWRGTCTPIFDSGAHDTNR